MPIKIEEIPQENEAIVFVVTLTDEDGDALTPTGFTWSLKETDGTVVNDRENEVESPASTGNIVLNHLDTALTTAEEAAGEKYAKRILEVFVVYDSTYGNNLQLIKTALFEIENNSIY
jgi:hypothetical protein